MRQVFMGMLLVLGLTLQANAVEKEAGIPPQPGGLQGGARNESKGLLQYQKQERLQQILNACDGKAEGAICQSLSGGAGKCVLTHDKKSLVCKPDLMPVKESVSPQKPVDADSSDLLGKVSSSSVLVK